MVMLQYFELVLFS